MLGNNSEWDMKQKFIKKAKILWENNQSYLSGEILYENLRKRHKPLWAVEVLELCKPLVEEITEIEQLCTVAKDPKRWLEAGEVFSAIRTLALEQDSFETIQSMVFSLAENVAKVIYNASGKLPPYDHDSGYKIVSDLKRIVDRTENQDFGSKAWYVVSCAKYSE